MTSALRVRLPLLVAAGLLLTGCGGPIDVATAGDFQAEVRTIASTAAAGDSAGAIVLAQRLKAEVDSAQEAGTVNEDRATLIGMRIDAVIASLEAEASVDEVPSGEVPSSEVTPGDVPSGEVPSGEVPAEETPAGETPAPIETPAPVEPSADPVPPPAESSPVEPVSPEPDAPVDEGTADDGGSADDGDDSGDAGTGTPEEDAAAPGNSGDGGANQAGEQQRKAAQKAAEEARDKAKGNGGKDK
ncbi:LPS-assembly lipoprotein LptE [Arthrobacter sedimenti]|uniref:hypothetical protein n=1 Tax=Arthrobacter sedimenti TaxID=2694931 RepID=UPI000B34DE49|nr:hypothetical protein [Arthrobacter sedimenti]OUM45310.1 hypothetical protein B8W73_00985 [Arthrobacter agilis]